MVTISFSDYLDLRTIDKSYMVVVNEAEASQIVPLKNKGEKIVILKIKELFYSYLLTPTSKYLWTMDEDGNKKLRSCFVFKSEKIDQIEFHQKLRV